MPIVSKRIEYRRIQADGRIRVREEHTDDKGNLHYVGPYMVANNAEADSRLAARDLDLSLRERDMEELIQWVKDGNTVSSYPFAERDIALPKGEERVVREFARHRGEPALRLAWWVDSLTVARWNNITDVSRLNWDQTRKDRVRARAATLAAAVTDFDDEEDV